MKCLKCGWKWRDPMLPTRCSLNCLKHWGVQKLPKLSGCWWHRMPKVMVMSDGSMYDCHQDASALCMKIQYSIIDQALMHIGSYMHSQCSEHACRNGMCELGSLSWRVSLFYYHTLNDVGFCTSSLILHEILFHLSHAETKENVTCNNPPETTLISTVFKEGTFLVCVAFILSLCIFWLLLHVILFHKSHRRRKYEQQWFSWNYTLNYRIKKRFFKKLGYYFCIIKFYIHAACNSLPFSTCKTIFKSWNLYPCMFWWVSER